MDSQSPVISYIFDQIINRVDPDLNKSSQLRKHMSPEELKDTFDINIPQKRTSNDKILGVIQDLMEKSVNTNHPYFMNQMFGKTQPIAYLADVLITLLNTSMYTYEVAPVLTLIENETIDFLTKKIWDRSGDGVFTAGGSMSNMKAMFLARQRKLEDSNKKGLNSQKPVAIFISEQAHYSFIKGVNFLGLGTDSLIKIPTLSNAKIDLKALEEIIIKTKNDGRLPLMLTAIAGTTISGTFDDIEALAHIAKKYDMWYHVDACFGGALLFSDQERQILNGIEHADSVSWNFHKVMGMPLSTATFLTREKGLLDKAFSVDADYLFHKNNTSNDLGQKSLQGGRRPDVLKLWLSLKYIGQEGFRTHVESLREKALFFSNEIEKNPQMELFQTAESAIVCFRYISDNIKDEKEIDAFNIKIREQIFQEGEMIFNYAYLNDKVYLRFVILDPDITHAQLLSLLSTIEKHAEALLVNHSTSAY